MFERRLVELSQIGVCDASYRGLQEGSLEYGKIVL